ncbi:MAG: hypothetical protein V8R40_05225 [Dysosmobacter sp.]
MNIREKILVVEDEKSISHFISTVLNSHGYEAIQARWGQKPCPSSPLIARIS